MYQGLRFARLRRWTSLLLATALFTSMAVGTAFAASLLVSGPTFSAAGATSDHATVTGTLADGFTLPTTNVGTMTHSLAFVSPAFSAPVAAEFTALVLTPVDATQTAALVAYYADKPEPWKTYLDEAAAGTKPFAYLKSDGTLIDAAMHDVAKQDVAMRVPDTFVLGTYTVAGTVADSSANTSTVTLKLIVTGDRVAPTFSAVGATSDHATITGSLADGFKLPITNDANVTHSLAFVTPAFSESVEDTYTALVLQPATGQTAALVAYYADKPAAYQTYLNAAAAGTEPFAYLKSDGTLIDGAQHFLASQDVAMRVPDNFVLGTYTVAGTISDAAGNTSTVTLKLMVTDGVAPTFSAAGATSDGAAIAGTLADGFTLPTANVGGVTHSLAFVTPAFSESVEDTYTALVLQPATGQTAALVAYYADNPEPWKTYLGDAAAGTKPFAYLKSDGTLIDAAMHDLATQDVAMRVPDTCVLGTYRVAGTISDAARNTSIVTLKLIVAGSSATTYTVTFKGYDGSVLTTNSVSYGSAAAAPTAPALTGFTFTGWDKAFDTITGDLTVTAQYAVTTYTVTFKDYDGSVLTATSVSHGSAATAPSAPTRTGYDFAGWDKAFGTVTGDLTVTAQYTVSAKIRTALSFKSTPTSSYRGHAFVFAGKISPSSMRTGTRITVWMRKSGQSWRKLGTVFTNVYDNYSYTLFNGSRTHGTYYVRVKYAGNSVYASSYSPYKKVYIK